MDKPKVYCDGFYEPGQPLGIGVYSADCAIEIALQVHQPGTNNVAECLGAITALEECKKRGISGIRLLSDSELVVNWANGKYELKSSTAQKYAPRIRELLSELRATIEWIAGSTNLADKYSRNLHLFPDGLSPLEKLKTIPPDRLASSDFIAVKSGRDEFTAMKEAAIADLLNLSEWQQLGEAFYSKKDQLSAARWRLRGLPLATAIRKVQVELEIGIKIAERRNNKE